MSLPQTEITYDTPADVERRFAGLLRLYGPQTLECLGAAHVAVVGIGGVGSWAAEALARNGVGALTLVDLVHIAESNVNWQVHALTQTLGQSKVLAMAERILAINPQCRISTIDDFLTPENVERCLPAGLNAVIDCTDQMAAKVAMVLHAKACNTPLIVCGGAGGKTDSLALRTGDLVEATHDALLARLRNVLRRSHGYPRAVDAQGQTRKRIAKLGVRVLWVDQPTILPAAWQQNDPLQGLSCAGYGSSVNVTASMGFAAANLVIQQLLAHHPKN